MRHLGHLEEAVQLGAHHGRAADRAVQHGLVHDRPDPEAGPSWWSRSWRLGRKSHPVPRSQSGGTDWWLSTGHGPRVVLGLEEGVGRTGCRNCKWTVAADSKPKVRLEPVGQDVAVLGPPVRLGRTGGPRRGIPTAPARRSRRTAVSRSVTSRILNLTRPVSIRLILDRDPLIRPPATSGVMPAASRKRRNCVPSSRRSTIASTGAPPKPGNGCSPPGSIVLITASMPIDRCSACPVFPFRPPTVSQEYRFRMLGNKTLERTHTGPVGDRPRDGSPGQAAHDCTDQSSRTPHHAGTGRVAVLNGPVAIPGQCGNGNSRTARTAGQPRYAAESYRFPS